ncbi:methionine ABC transporter ATP-binding protein [Bifidobacterium margollesii]|uniref:Methionine ABC transporter ATP-binding protein n=1 Tax=Bifidobacterium margollesii TaxID=2020964 RepID=A0A2N5J7W3_9BIFI|nr:ATP-binding cassette domain-containing protein [Bifidobacterium margollesii]PLS30285.1 methionine ABC transporter ATP-binding protein [Bifidobacterium margollesii]
MPESIVIRDVTKTVLTPDGPKSLLKGVNLHLEQGRIYGVIGLGGAGKSTLLKLIAGEIRPTSGTVELFGRSIRDVSDSERADLLTKVAKVGVFPNLTPNQTIIESVTEAAQQVEHRIADGGEPDEKDKPRLEPSEIALHLLRALGLRALKNLYPEQLSGGELQRASVAKALAADPRVLLLDEVTGALDHLESREILRLIRRLVKERNITVVLATHEISAIKEICDNVIVLDKGLVVEEGPSHAVIADPQADRTRAFVQSASSLGKVSDLLAGSDPVVDLRPGQKLISLRYVSEDVSEPLVSLVTRKFGIDVNIMLADIQIVGKYPIGGIVGIFEGPERNIRDAITFLRGKKVRVEIIAEN